MKSFVAIGEVEYEGQLGIRTSFDYFFTAGNRQQAIDISFSRIINSEEDHFEGLERVLFNNVFKKHIYYSYAELSDHNNYLSSEYPFYKGLLDNNCGIMDILTKGSYDLKQAIEYLKSKRLLKGMIDRNKDIHLEIVEANKIKRERERIEKENNGFLYDSQNRKIPHKDVDDFEFIRSGLVDVFYCFGGGLGWREDILDKSGFLRPTRLNDEEIRDTLIEDANYNKKFYVDPEKLKNKEFLI